MTTTNHYTITPDRDDRRLILGPDADLPRIAALAYHFRGRKIKGGYIFTPHRAKLFDQMYRAGFTAKHGQLIHPKIPKRKFSASKALHVILLAKGIGD